MELELKLICGNHLAVQDIYTSDPYIKFEAGGKKYKSKKINSTLHPKWKETFKINAKIGEEIIFECYDYDIIGKDDKMGKSKWIVPQMFNGDKDYFILENNVRGNIVI